jgi:hypothetical protein
MNFRLLAAAIAVTAAAATATNAHAGEAAFVFGCHYSHTLRDDPIAGGAAHLHDFIGNRSTNASSTHDSLLTAPTNCNVYGSTASDMSAYWIPSLVQYQLDGTWKPIPPGEATIYYMGYTPNLTAVRPFPVGFRMIGGDSRATAAQQTWKVSWLCFNGSTVDQARPQCIDDPTNPSPTLLRLRFVFPRCWDGQRLDSPDHKVHVAYPDYPWSGLCPAAYPVPLPEIQMYVLYRTAGGPPPGPAGPVPGDVTIASGGQYSMHADFMEAWNPAVQSELVAKCLWSTAVKCTA